VPRPAEEDLGRYLLRLRGLAFVKKAGASLRTNAVSHEEADGVLSLQSPKSTHLFDLEVKPAPLTYAVADAAIARHKRRDAEKESRALMLFAPHISRSLAVHLASKDVNFLDEAGNCHVQMGMSFMAHIEGRTATARPGLGRGIGLTGHLALFAILPKPELLNSSIRTFAEQAVVSKTAVEHILARLTQERTIVRGRNRRYLLDKKALLDRWLSGYATLVRPRPLVGQYRTQDTDPPTLEGRIEQVLTGDKPWGWDGGVAPRRVHPLLVYTELLTEGTDRARESAEMIRKWSTTSSEPKWSAMSARRRMRTIRAGLMRGSWLGGRLRGERALTS
jgi:hypothetical protein